MSKKLRIVLAQLDLIVGDIAGNLQKLIQAATEARDQLAADIIVFPELSITGYPPEDLLFRKGFLQAAHKALYAFVAEVQNIYCVVGHPHTTSQGLFNSCSIIYNGTILGRYAKQHLPNYGVFDECRYFIPGNAACVIPIHGIPVGVVICEDLWALNPVSQAATQGARIILSPNASPFEINKHERRLHMLTKRARTNNLPIVYVNTVGGQDDIMFDGDSMVVDATGKLCQQAPFLQEALLPVDIEFSSTAAIIPINIQPTLSEEKKIYDCLVRGLRDYLAKNHFPGVLIGVSGGIDSALTLAIAVDAIGKDKVHAVMLPSRYTANISLEDALTLVKNLDVSHETISIEPIFNSFLQALAESFGDKKVDFTEENLQARCRGTVLMALSNKTGKIVLVTSNRSEMAVGYTTLYGDMAGGFAVLKDVSKTWVYRLAHYRNSLSPVIPQRVIERPPTAELALNQKDEDSLPPYAILDNILDAYINQELSAEDIIKQGFDPEIVIKVLNLIKKAEYKRRQAPIGTRINHNAFSRDRRYPITSGFKEG